MIKKVTFHWWWSDKTAFAFVGRWTSVVRSVRRRTSMTPIRHYCSMWWFVLLASALVLLLLFCISTQCQYYMKMTFFYASIFVHGCVCHILMIPSFLRQEGADVIFHTFRYYCFWTGVNVDVHGYDEHLKHLEGPAVVICNHQSAIDVIVMTHVWPPRGVVMMKNSLKYIPFFNTCSYMANTIFVNRFTKGKAMGTVEQCVQQLTQKYLKLWIFPEGTRNRDGEILPFKKGAFNIAVKAQIPIIPIVTSDYRPFYSKPGKYFHNDGEIIVQVLPPIHTTGKTEEDVTAMAEEIHGKMSEVHKKISKEALIRISEKRAKKTA